MTNEAIYRILQVLLWVCIILNGWCMWRNWRMSRAFRKAVRALNEQRVQLRDAANIYEKSSRKYMERLAEEQKDD